MNRNTKNAQFIPSKKVAIMDDFFFITKTSIVLMKRYTRHIHLQKTNRGDNTTAPYGEPNQSTKSIKEVILSPMYTLIQSQKRYKKKLLIV